MFKKTLKMKIYKILLTVFFVPTTTCLAGTVIKDPAGKVERAGVILIKKYGKNDFAVIVGEDQSILQNHGNHVVSFTAGGCEKNDKYTTETAARETKEETNNHVNIKPKALISAPYVYSVSQRGLNNPSAGGIKLFVKMANNVSVDDLNQDIKRGIKGKRGYGEMSAFYAIPLKDLVCAAKKVANSGFSSSPNKTPHTNYMILTRGDGKGNNRKKVYFQENYLRAIAKNIKVFEAILTNQTVKGKKLGTRVIY